MKWFVVYVTNLMSVLLERRTQTMLTVCLFCAYSVAQTYISRDVQGIIAGEHVTSRFLSKTVLPSIGEDGTVWDFRNVKIEKNSFVSEYIKDKNNDKSLFLLSNGFISRLVQNDDSLVCLGYEDNLIKVTYLHPELRLAFPMILNDRHKGYVDGYGIYCDKVRFRVVGTYNVAMVGRGVLLMPNGDTLKNAMLVHSRTLYSYLCSEVQSDSTLAWIADSIRINPDSIDNILIKGNAKVVKDTYQWFAAGIRHPLIETIICKGGIFDKGRIQYSVINADALSKNEDFMDEQERDRIPYSFNSSTADGSFRYVASINKDCMFLIKYFSTKEIKISIGLYDYSGRTVYVQKSQSVSAGEHYKTINMNGMPNGVYILKIVAGIESLSGKFTKSTNP
mgnify:CR=1 FL=1